MTTWEPGGPLVGLKPEIVGALPPDVVTLQFAVNPVGNPPGTVAVICVGELTVKFAAFENVPLTRATAVTFVKLVPVIVMGADRAARGIEARDRGQASSAARSQRGRPVPRLPVDVDGVRAGLVELVGEPDLAPRARRAGGRIGSGTGVVAPAAASPKNELQEKSMFGPVDCLTSWKLD